MADNTTKRKRKANLDAMTPEQQEQVGLAIGQKVGKLCDETAKELTKQVNAITSIYGLKAQIQIVFTDSDGKIITP